MLDCDPEAVVYYGFKQEVSLEEDEAAIRENTLIELLNVVQVKPGDVFFIEAGVIHAIGASILVAKVQQNPNVTYRVSDFGRLGADGKPRQLHIAQALDVTTLPPPRKDYDFGGHLAACEYFVVDKLDISGKQTNIAGTDSFHHLLILDGEGIVICGDEHVSFAKGDSLFIGADSGEYYANPWQPAPPSDNTEISHRIYTQFHTLCDYLKDNKRSRNIALIDGITTYCAEHYCNPDIGLQTIADHFHITAPYLSRFFKEQTGANINRHINHLRIEYAKKLLRNSNFSIGEIADQVGYGSDASFIRVFKKTTGTTPGLFRQQHRSKQ